MELEISDSIYTLMTTNSKMFAGRHSGLYQFRNQEWVSVYQGLGVDQAPPTTAVAISSHGEFIICGVEGGVMFSDDSGKNWKAIQFPEPPSVVSTIALSPHFDTDKTIIVGLLDDGIYHSCESRRNMATSKHRII